jgi:hypothetical protein
MLKTNLYLTLEDGSERTFAESDVRGIQACIEVTPVRMGDIEVAGPLQGYLLIRTALEEVKIPRLPANDKEILDFIFSNCDIQKKPNQPWS